MPVIRTNVVDRCGNKLMRVLVFALVSMAQPIGCDRSESRLDQRQGLKDDTRQIPGDIRVLLMDTQSAKVTCNDGPYCIWHGQGDNIVAEFDTKTICSIGRKNGMWQIKVGSKKSLETEKNVSAETIEIRPKNNGYLSVGKDRLSQYRGNLRIKPQGPQRFAVINVIDIESYLAGVVGAEMPGYWHKAALRAQAVASRTYALYRIHCRKNNGDWDLRSDQLSQVYGGVKSESRRVTESIRETSGMVLAYGPEGEEKIFPTYYSSTCGGHTQNAAEVFGESLKPLTGGPCPYCQSVAAPKYYRWEPVTVKKDLAARRLMKKYPELEKKIGQPTKIRVAKKSNYGRLERIELIDSNNKKATVRAEVFRLAVSTPENPISSSWCNIVDMGDSWKLENGHGWGHGVGLCQCGAQQMAKIGKNCTEILGHYYPGSELIRAY